MFLFEDKDLVLKNAKLNALDRSQAIIEFSPEGIIQSANTNFLSVMGYSLNEIKGQHHSIFVDEAEKSAPAYKEFWRRLQGGEYQQAEYRRIAKGGRDVWIQASYNPLFDKNGKVFGVVKFASDITAQKIKGIEDDAKLAAIAKSMATIEFLMDGTILDANQNFLATLGYESFEVVGKHHRMFVEPKYAASQEYADFWKKLARGEFQAAQYKRLGKGGREIWIEASYNPIFDGRGVPYKVVKYATEITRQISVMQNVIDNLTGIESSISLIGRQAATSSEGAVESSQNMDTIASAVEEMNASVTEISSSMTQSHQAVGSAIEQTDHADVAVKKLEGAAAAMSGIVETIQNIASQINLLSLNATIEAARAGESGKGFAVVAGEVKSLARQAADATSSIGSEIGNVQAISREVSGNLDEIKASVRNVENYVASTASAVEEQSAVTLNISTTMQQAAIAARGISDNMIEITRAVEETSALANATKEEAGLLKK